MHPALAAMGWLSFRFSMLAASLASISTIGAGVPRKVALLVCDVLLEGA